MAAETVVGVMSRQGMESFERVRSSACMKLSPNAEWHPDSISLWLRYPICRGRFLCRCRRRSVRRNRSGDDCEDSQSYEKSCSGWRPVDKIEPGKTESEGCYLDEGEFDLVEFECRIDNDAEYGRKDQDPIDSVNHVECKILTNEAEGLVEVVAGSDFVGLVPLSRMVLNHQETDISG